MTKLNDIAQLALWPDNYNEGDVGAIAASIERFGFNGALSVWADNMVVKGNHSLMALWSIKSRGPLPAREQWPGYTWPPVNVTLGPDDEWLVDCVSVSHLSETEAVAYAIADNRTARLATQDETKLAKYLTAMFQSDEALGRATGYDPSDLDDLLANMAPPTSKGTPDAQPDRAAELQAKWKTARGQRWIIPSVNSLEAYHVLYCGDATNPQDRALAVGDDTPALLLTDPPYAKEYASRGAKGAVEIAGEGSIIDTLVIAKNSVKAWYIKLNKDDAVLYDPRLEPDNWIVWAKQGFGLGGGDFRPQHEFLLYGRRGGECKAGADVGDVWNQAVPFRGRMLHVAETPVDIWARCLQYNSDPHDVILDLFAGSASVLAACENTYRVYRGIEIDPGYVAVGLQRAFDMGMNPTLQIS